MEYRLFFFDFFGQVMGVTPFDARDNQTAIVVAIELSESVRDQRTELWDGRQLVMRRSFPEVAGAD
jgi:hypothetical protein